MKIIYFLIFVLGVVFSSYSQKLDTTLVKQDTLSDIITTIHFVLEGTSYSMDGAAGPKKMLRTIQKKDKQGTVIYESELETVMQGCVRNFIRFTALSKDKNGAYKTILMRKKGFETRTYNASGKLLMIKTNKYLSESWLDPEENKYIP
jgi:hypothetical protein